MAIFDGMKRQLRSVIEWQNYDPDILFHQWTENGDEIKNASRLVVGPGQGCIFVYEGKIMSVLDHEGLVELKTDNLPFVTTLKKFMQFFESEHNAALYFFRRTAILDQKWGTSAPIKYEDPKYNFPVGLKAFGNYSYKIQDAKKFFMNVVGSRQDFAIEDFRIVMSARIVQPLADFLAESSFTYAEIDRHREEIAQGLIGKLLVLFESFGFEITDFRIEGTDFDEETLKRINRISDMAAEAQAAQAVGLDYARVQQLEAMREAARNTNGGAGVGLGLGAGVALGKKMAKTLDLASSLDAEDGLLMAKLAQLKQLREAELITEEEYTAKKGALLERL